MQAHWTTESATDGGWSGQGSLAQNARGAFFSAKKALEGAFNRRTALRASLLEVWNVDIRQALRICEGMLGVRFPRPLMSTRLWRAFCRGFAKVIAVWTARHAAVAISASLSETAFLDCCFQQSKPRDLLIQAVLLSFCNVFIICTSSSTVAVSFCTDGHVNCNFCTSLHCE